VRADGWSKFEMARALTILRVARFAATEGCYAVAAVACDPDAVPSTRCGRETEARSHVPKVAREGTARALICRGARSATACVRSTSGIIYRVDRSEEPRLLLHVCWV
jgi:hypothetical protein